MYSGTLEVELSTTDDELVGTLDVDSTVEDETTELLELDTGSSAPHLKTESLFEPPQVSVPVASPGQGKSHPSSAGTLPSSN